MPRLKITKGPGAGQDHAVGTECVLGRSADVDFVLEDPLVSRRHARVFRDGPGYAVEDLASRNGTVVNARKVQRQKLEDGDVIVIGTTELVFRQKDMYDAGGGRSAGRQESERAAPPATEPTTTAPAIVSPPASAAVGKPAAPKPGAAPGAPAPKPIVAPVPARKRRP